MASMSVPSTTYPAFALGALLTLALPASAASAPFGTVCFFQGGGGAGSGQPFCAEASGGGGGGLGSFESVPLPGQLATATGAAPVTVGVTGAGALGGLASTASAFAGPGLLRAKAQATAPSVASIPNGDDSQYLAVSRAGAYFIDSGTIDAPGAVLGTPVLATATLDVTGSFGKFGEATVDLSATGLAPVHGTLLAGNPALHLVFDLPNLHVGDAFSIKLDLIAKAAAFVQLGKPGLLFDIADVGNTAHFYLDFADANVSFNALSGHDYGSPVPLPAAAPLLCTAFFVVGAMTRRTG